MTESNSKLLEFPLIEKWDEIGLDQLKAFPYWISSEDLGLNPEYWDEADPPEWANFDEESLDRWVVFPKDFSRQELIDEDENTVFWTPDLVEIAKKHGGILFFCEGSETFEIDCSDTLFGRDFEYRSVFPLLRFETRLGRFAAAKEIRRQKRELPLFLGSHPEEPGDFRGAGFLAIARY